MTVEQLEKILSSKEGEHLEFKEAKKKFHFETLVKYCAALANEGGGKIVLGVTDNRPRSVVGSQAFKQPERTRSGLIEQLHLNIDFSIVNHPNGRVLIFHVPTHPIGNPVKYILSRRYYKMIDKKGDYTRKKGLDRETNKALLLKYIEGNRDSGSRLKELMQVLPALSNDQVKKLVAELKREEKIYNIGATRAALWYPRSETDVITSGKNG